MTKKAVNIVSMLITALILAFLGIFMLFMSDIFFTVFHTIVSCALIVTGVLLILSFFTGKKKVGDGIVLLFEGFCVIAFGIIVLCFKDYFFVLFPALFSLYALINAVIRIISFSIFIKQKTPNVWSVLLSGLMSLTFCIILISKPFGNITMVFNIIAIYLILYSSTYFIDIIKILLVLENSKRAKRRFRVTLPVFLCALMPYRVLTILNRNFSIKSSNNLKDNILLEDNKLNSPPDLEIFIHVSNVAFGVMGHLDLYFDGQVISYGSYDESTQKMGAAFGDGVLFFTSKKDDYINFCMNHNKKTIFTYGLKLTQQQKCSIRAKISKIKLDAHRWYPLAVTEINKVKNLNNLTDYASMLYLATKPKFYKFSSGPFQTYFVLQTNCAQLADEIIGSTGSDILGINGIITPGTYYEYLEREYQIPNSSVISKVIYHKNFDLQEENCSVTQPQQQQQCSSAAVK